MGNENDHQQDRAQGLNAGDRSTNRSQGRPDPSGRIERILGLNKATAQRQPNAADAAPEEPPTLRSPLFRQYARLLDSIAQGVDGDHIPPGASAPYVAAIQMALRQLFPSFVPSTYGTYDAATVDAIETFQRREGLTEDGNIGQETLLALDGYGFSRRGADGESIRPKGHTVGESVDLPAKISATAEDIDIARGDRTHLHRDQGEDTGIHHEQQISGVRVYSGPSDRFKLKFTVNYNEDVVLVGYAESDPTWALIQASGGQEGWMNKDYVTTVGNAGDGSEYTLYQSNLHLVGETENNLHDLVVREYGSEFVETHDARLIIQAIARLNVDRQALYYDNQERDLAWWEDLLLNENEEDARRTYQSVGIRTGLNLILPEASLIEQMKAAGDVTAGSISEKYKGAIDFMKLYGGYLVGVPEGLWEGLVGTFQAIPELVQLFRDTIVAAMNGELLDQVTEIGQAMWEFITTLDEQAAAWWREFLLKPPFEQGRTIGKGVGMIAFEVLLALATGGAANALRATGMGARIVAASSRASRAVAAFGDDVARMGQRILNNVDDLLDPLPEMVTTNGQRVRPRRNDLMDWEEAQTPQRGGDRMHMEGNENGYLEGNSSGPYVPSGPMRDRRIGHTFSKHGSHNTEELLHQARNGGSPQGQWLDDAGAEEFIANHLDQLGQGAITVELPEGLGRVINTDGTFSPATHAVLVPSKSGVKTAYPIIE